MALTLVPKYVRALAEHLNATYRVFRGTDPDSIDLRLNGGGHFIVHHSGTNAPVFTVTDAGATGAYQPGDITNPDLADGAVTSAKIADDTIVNADINGAAGIAVTKIAHVGANNVLRSTGGQNVGGQVVSADIANDTIMDADINGAAGILVTKLAHVGAGNVLRSTGTQNVGGPLVAADIPNNSITSAKIVDNEIVNADINAAAAIAYGKLALSNGIVNADVNAAAAIAYGKLALSNGIVNADVNAAAAIAPSKLAQGGTASRVLATDAANAAVAMQQVTGAMVAPATMLNTNFADNTISGARLQDNSVPAIKISGGATIPANSIDSSHIVDGSIMAADLNIAATMRLIAKTSFAGASPGTAFNAIPSGYSALRIVANLRNLAPSLTDTVLLRMGATTPDSTNNYDLQSVIGASSTAAAGDAYATNAVTVGACPGATATAGRFATIDIVIPNYALAGSCKDLLSSFHLAWGISAGLQQTGIYAGLWRGTSAVDTILLFSGVGNYAAGSVVMLYGIP